MDEVTTEKGSASPEAAGAGFGGFLREALARVFDRRALVPALVLLVLLTGSNIVLLLNLPTSGGPSLPFIIAGLLRIFGVVFLAVGILRIIAPSQRSPWRPDGGFWLYVLTFLLSLRLTALLAQYGTTRADWVGLAINSVILTVVLSLFATWFVAIAVVRPLALDPRPYMRDFGRWYPQLLLWSLAIVTPLSVTHALLDMWLLQGAGDSFWPVALFDGALSTLMALVGLGLNATAYTRVARD